MTLTYMTRDLGISGQTSAVKSCKVSEASYTCTVEVSLDDYLLRGHDDGYIAVQSPDGETEVYRIMSVTKQVEDAMVQLYAESIGYELGYAAYIHDKRPNAVTAAAALGQALAGTGWDVGTVASTASRSTTWYDISPLAALNDIASVWGVRYRFRVTIDGAAISGKYVDLLSTTPVWRGKRYRYGKDIATFKHNLDSRNLVTALYGRGKGEVSGDGWGRRLTFSEVAWTIAAGNPTDKPAGQDWVADPAAVSAYGLRYALATYPSCEDAADLLQLTWQDLQTRCHPILTITMTAIDLEAMGYPHEAARVGDQCLVIADEIGIEALASIAEIERDYVDPSGTQIVFGQPSTSLSSKVASSAGTWDRAGAISPVGTITGDLVAGALDVALTQLFSSKSNFYTDATGASIWESPDGTSAMRISSAGWQIASGKNSSGAWVWRTAATGAGMVATEITTGTLNANIVKTGRLASASDTDVYFDLDTGELAASAVRKTVNGRIMRLHVGQDAQGEWGASVSVNGVGYCNIRPMIGGSGAPNGVAIVGPGAGAYDGPCVLLWEAVSGDSDQPNRAAIIVNGSGQTSSIELRPGQVAINSPRVVVNGNVIS